MVSVTYLSLMSKEMTPTTAPIRALIYARASQDRLKLMRSISDQIRDCRSWCKPLGWKVVRVLADADRSASQWSRKEREGFEEALELIRSGKIDGFVTWGPSRAGRDLDIYLQLRAACQTAGVLYLTQGRVFDFSRSDDNFMLGFEFLRAEADANTMRERQLRTARILAEKGRPHGRIPYGYQRVYDSRTGVLIGQEPDPHTGEIVRWISEQVLRGEPLSQIAHQLQDQGEPTPHGARKGNVSRGWTASSVKQIMRNPTIAGKRVFRGEIIGDADWAPLVSAEDFARIQRLLFDPSRRVHVSNGVTAKSLLSHIAKCDCCSRPLQRILSRPDKNGIRRVRYQCRFRGCYKVTIMAPELDEHVSEFAIAWLSDPGNAALLVGEDEEWAAHATEAQNCISALEARLQAAIDSYAAGDIDLAMLTQVDRLMTPRIEQAQQLLTLPIADRTIRDLINAEDLATAWQELEFAEQRRIIKALFEVRIMPAAKLGRYGFQPDRIIVSARAKVGEA